MRIALFTDTYLPQVNGVARTLSRLVEHAVRRGHEVALIAPRLGPESGPHPLHIELPAWRLPFYDELRLALPMDPWSGRRLDAFAPDVVHVATEFTVGWSGLAYAARASLPLVTSFHTDFPAYLGGYGLGGLEGPAWSWLRSFHAGARATLCPSVATLRQLRSQGFRGDLRVWPRGVDVRSFHPGRRREEVRARLAPGADTILLYVGRLAPEKRLDLLLEAFRAIRARRSDVALVVVGDGPEREALRAAAPDGVFFTGFLSGDALADAYAAADVFTFPSDTETFGNVVLEAMASGLPVVAPRRGGVRDTVRHGETGLLVEPGDRDAFAAATLDILGDPELARGLAVRARERAESMTWEGILDGVLAVYAEAGITTPERAA